MTPNQFRSAIKSLGLSQPKAGRLLGAKGERTPRRWASGEIPVPAAAAAILRLLLAGKLTLEDVKRAHDH
jgi:hypothetical protein